MLKLSKLATASAISALFVSSAAFAEATFMPVAPPADAFEDIVVAIGINDKGEVAGSYTTDGVDELGIVGSIDGTYESWDLDGNPTQARGVNNQGAVVGFAFNQTSGTIDQFERAKDGTLTVITKDETPLIGIVQGINASGDFVGDYVGEPGAVPQRGGYQGSDGVWESDVTLPFTALRVAPRAINAQGDVAGWFITEDGTSVQGFLTKGGETTVLVYPGANITYVQGLNNKGELSGSYQGEDGNLHGFALDSDLETWTSFDAPGAITTQAWQINNQGQIAVSGSDGTSTSSYIYCPKKSGVCSGNKGKKGTTSSATSAALTAPAASNGNGPVDPETMGKKVGHNKM